MEKNCDASKEELRDWRKMEAKTAATTLWSLRREQWVWERGAEASEAKNTHSSLDKRPYPCVQCGSKLHSHLQTLSITVHFAILLTFHTSWPTIPKAHATPTYRSNAHLLVQRSLRCAWGLHCKYVNLVLLHFMLLLVFCHQIQHCIISTGGTSTYASDRTKFPNLYMHSSSSLMFISHPLTKINGLSWICWASVCFSD